MSDEHDILTVEEVARYLKVTERHVYKLLSDRKIHAALDAACGQKIRQYLIQLPDKLVTDIVRRNSSVFKLRILAWRIVEVGPAYCHAGTSPTS